MIKGTRVKVKDQDIIGTVIKHDVGNKYLILDDDDSWTDNESEATLIFHKDELEIIGFVDPRGYEVDKDGYFKREKL